MALGVIFVWAGLTKLTHVEGFADIISAYDLVPETLLGLVAMGIPALEVAAGLGLVFDIRGSLSTVLALLLLFVLVLWFGILKDLDIDCGCFTGDDLAKHGALRAAMLRDLAMMAAGGYLIWWRRAVPMSPRGLVLKRE